VRSGTRTRKLVDECREPLDILEQATDLVALGLEPRR
jgi:hypothetical protein